MRESKFIQLYTLNLKSVGSNSKMKKSSKVILKKKKKKRDFKKLSKTKTSSLGVDQFHHWELPFLLLSPPSSQDPHPSENPERFTKLLTKLQSTAPRVLVSSVPATQKPPIYLPVRNI